jgi:lactoylglutathione lyase
MISFRICLLLLLLPLYGEAQVRINHTAIFVTNVALSGSFYQRVLGLERIADPFQDDQHIWLRTSPTTSMHIIGKADGVKEYFKNHHTCYSVVDFDGCLQRLREDGTAFEDVNGKANSFSVRKDGIRQIYLRDPDGYWLEVNDEK